LPSWMTNPQAGGASAEADPETDKPPARLMEEGGSNENSSREVPPAPVITAADLLAMAGTEIPNNRKEPSGSVGDAANPVVTSPARPEVDPAKIRGRLLGLSNLPAWMTSGTAPTTTDAAESADNTDVGKKRSKPDDNEEKASTAGDASDMTAKRSRGDGIYGAGAVDLSIIQGGSTASAVRSVLSLLSVGYVSSIDVSAAAVKPSNTGRGRGQNHSHHDTERIYGAPSPSTSFSSSGGDDPEISAALNTALTAISEAISAHPDAAQAVVDLPKSSHKNVQQAFELLRRGRQ
jgi:hypothetical protein